MRMIFGGVAIACLIAIALTSSVKAQIAGTLDMQTNCEHALAGMRTVGDQYQLRVDDGDLVGNRQRLRD